MPNKIKYPVVDGMKECATCRLVKPVSEYTRARKYYAAQCKGCRKKYAAEYRQKPEVKAQFLNWLRQYRSVPENREKLNAKIRAHRKKPSAKVVRNTTRRAWTAREKQKAVEYKGGKCVCCGYSECFAALDFHHKDPLQKEGYGTGALKSHWSFERNKAELDKCELVCVRCHREIHAGYRVLPCAS